MGKHTKELKRKNISIFIILLLLILAIVLSLVGANIEEYNQSSNSKIKVSNEYMSSLTQKLMEEDDENLVSTKYLITDSTIERIREDTTVEQLKKDLEDKVTIYKDSSLQEEVTQGMITGMMVAVDKENNIYNLVISGDVNKDGKVNEIDISKIIRAEIPDEISQIASEVGTNKIVDKIVFGKFELEEVTEVKSPEIEIASGELGENEWYTSDVQIKIKQIDESGIKTVYKIKGSQEQDVTVITESETITLAKDGVYKIIAYTYGKEGNKSKISQKIVKVNKTGIEAVVSYSTDTETTESVIATVTFNKEGVKITNNDGKNTYEFTKNGEFTFEYIDEAGRTGAVVATVNWIKQKEIIGKDNEWKYFINEDGTIQLTQYLGTKTELTVPAQYDGYTVYAVGNQNSTDAKERRFNIFADLSNTTLTKVTIEEGIKEIKTAAFYSCTELKGNLVLPNSIISIGNYSFGNCKGLSGNLVFPDNIAYIGEASFNNCSGFSGNLVLPDSVTDLGRAAFQSCTGFKGTLTISKNLTQIPDYAFNNCKGLTGQIILPESITRIGKTAFQLCGGFSGTLVFPDTLTEIDDYAFNKCTNLTGDLIIPDTVTRIGKTAFQLCTGLNGTIRLSNKLTIIEDYTFFNCSNLKGDLVIPDTVTSIGKYAFYKCTSLNGTLKLSDNITLIDQSAFSNCSNLNGNLNLPKNLKEVGNYAFNQCNGFTGDLIMPDNLTIIGEAAFQSCTGLKGKLVLPKNINTIKLFAFYNNTFTGELILPEGLEILGEAAFGKSLNFENTKIVIPSTLKKIGIDCDFNGENLGLSTHDFYNFGINVKNFEEFEVAEGNENFVAVDGVLYTKDKKRLVSYPTNKKDETYEILEGVVTIDELSISSNMILETLIIPDSLLVNIREQYIRMSGTHVLTAALYSYNSVGNIVAKDTNPNYKSVDGVLYTKDLKELVYISSGRTKEVIIPEGVESVRESAVYYNQFYYMKISKVYIPASLVNIPDSRISALNNGSLVIEVAEDNPVFTVDSNNKLIKK